MSRSLNSCLEPRRVKEATAHKLRQRYQTEPGSASEDQLIREFLPLVKTVVGRIALTLPAHVDIDDLQSAGLVGLLHALRNFDENNGASLATYARIRIHGAVIDELRRMDCVSRGVRDKARKVQAVIAELEQANGRPPTSEEIAAALKLSVSEYEALLDEIKPVTFVCLDAADCSDRADGAERYESVADASQEDPLETASKRELAHLIEQRIQQLPEVQRKVLALYYFEDLRLREIAAAFGVTESRICQIHAQAILSIRAWLKTREAERGA